MAAKRPGRHSRMMKERPPRTLGSKMHQLWNQHEKISMPVSPEVSWSALGENLNGCECPVLTKARCGPARESASGQRLATVVDASLEVGWLSTYAWLDTLFGADRSVWCSQPQETPAAAPSQLHRATAFKCGGTREAQKSKGGRRERGRENNESGRRAAAWRGKRGSEH
eukprot:786797-Rhodomonas_salina.1